MNDLQAKFEEWWNGDRPGDPAPYGNGVQGHAWMAWQAALSHPGAGEPQPAPAWRDSFPPTHYCRECKALWRRWADGSWSLVTMTCGKCCDNVPMGEQIVRLGDAGMVRLENDRQWVAALRVLNPAERATVLETFNAASMAKCSVTPAPAWSGEAVAFTCSDEARARLRAAARFLEAEGYDDWAATVRMMTPSKPIPPPGAAS